ncbi:MAG: glycosyltransferase family 39 protein [Lachnospiraceae bacterium]|nr:glycosyltransferase family 39 protein [Lachnospiraceae bacterium]
MVKAMHTEKMTRKYLIAFLIIWVVQMAAAFYFCTQKQGFHEDEYYTYYSTARTNGFYVEDGQWMDRETYWNEFVVLPDQRFQYGLVRLVQSWDVHPPMYYWAFHTAASLVPNVFSKWIGLSVNLFFHGINIILLTYLSYLISRRDIKLSLFVSLFYGITPAAMSGVVFIRMYEMLTMMVLLCAILHVRAAEADEKKLSVRKCLVPMVVVTYVGFLTQYYYFIFLFYIAIAFGVWLLWRDRNLWNCIRYGAAQGASLLLAYLTYPSCLGQMFRGQRGAQATENFFNISNTLERFCFFGELMNRYAFGHLFFAGLLVILLFAVTIRRKSERIAKKGTRQSLQAHWERNDTCTRAGFKMLTFAAAGYFLTVSKTALLLGATSNRYQLPIYGIAVLLLFVGIRTLWRRAVRLSAVPECQKSDIFAWIVKHRKYAGYAVMALCLMTVSASLHFDGVIFLYPEDQEQTAFAKKCAEEDIPVVYLYQKGEEWCIWDVANELFAYPEVYFIDAQRGVQAQGEAFITDEKIRNADAMVVYIAKGADSDEQTMGIAGSNERGIDSVQCMFSEKYCNVYYFFDE